ncbi:MAG TPA: GntR family transcriptional regulator, partial [Chryseolinea sp.]
MSQDDSPPIDLLKKAFSTPIDSQLPLHARVYRGLNYAIENFFEDGQRFFTEKELIENLKVSQVTIRRAVYDLVKAGLLERRVAKGSFVLKKPKEETGQPAEIAIHLPDWDSSFLSQMLREVIAACGALQLQAKVFHLRQSGAISNNEGDAWKQSNISAAILLSIPHDQAAELSRQYEAAKIPVVAVDAKVPDNYAHFVGTDNHAITRLGLDYLASLNHKRICLLLNEPEATENVVLRAAFFEREC